VVTATLTITAGHTLEQNLVLSKAPTILLVDSGRWYNGSEIGYYRQALNDLGYLYDEWPIRNMNVDVPTTSTLRTFGAVIWSAPFDSPGYVNAGEVISDYLHASGRLLLSGQDVGYYDTWSYEAYYHDALLAQVSADSAASRHLTGTRTFAGLTLAISGTGGADNQNTPDIIHSLAPLFTEPAFDYEIDQLGGQTVGLCRPYRAVNLAFGFEAITDRAVRAEVMSRTFGVFDRAPQRQVTALEPAPDQLIAPAGFSATSTLAVQPRRSNAGDFCLAGRQRVEYRYHTDVDQVESMRVAHDHGHHADSAQPRARCDPACDDHCAPDRFARPQRFQQLAG
jgi:hypothetical protein